MNEIIIVSPSTNSHLLVHNMAENRALIHGGTLLRHHSTHWPPHHHTISSDSHLLAFLSECMREVSLGPPSKASISKDSPVHLFCQGSHRSLRNYSLITEANHRLHRTHVIFRALRFALTSRRDPTFELAHGIYRASSWRREPQKRSLCFKQCFRHVPPDPLTHRSLGRTGLGQGVTHCHAPSEQWSETESSRT